MEKIIEIIDGMKWEITLEPLTWRERWQGIESLMKKYRLVAVPHDGWFSNGTKTLKITETKCLTSSIDDFCENLNPEFEALELKLTSLIKEIEEKYKQFGLSVIVRTDKLPDNKRLRLLKVWERRGIVEKITKSKSQEKNEIV